MMVVVPYEYSMVSIYLIDLSQAVERRGLPMGKEESSSCIPSHYLRL